MLGPDGKPVIGVDGKIVMVNVEGKPIHGERNSRVVTTKPKEKGPGRKKFQKKTKQDFWCQAVRQLRREGVSLGHGGHYWMADVGRDVHKVGIHAMSLPTADNVFKFAPPESTLVVQVVPGIL